MAPGGDKARAGRYTAAPMPARPSFVPALTLLALLSGCAPMRPSPDWAAVHEITPAALLATAASDPSLAAGDGGRVALTWVTHDETGGADVWLALSADSGAHFAPPARVNLRDGGVSSYAESRPVAAFGPGQRLIVAWAARRAGAHGADDIAVRSSTDGGATLGAETLLNSDAADAASTYHGFIALAFDPAGAALAAWIDGRAAALAPGEDEPARSTIRLARSDDGGGTWGHDRLVAGNVCSCCRIALSAASPGSVAIAYRGARDDLRDPRLALSRDGGLSFPYDTLVSADHWLLSGCPSIGPGLTPDRGTGGLYAWYTAGVHAAAGPGVYVADWHPGGLPGPARPLADSLLEPTHPLLAAMGSAALAAVAARPRGDSARHVLALRLLEKDGAMTPWLLLGAHAQSGAIAGAGPRMGYAAWLEKTPDGPRVRAVRIERRATLR